ncbi:hypothetical protein V8C86DRAFT_2592696 [Haematococcus lacustris]
MAWAAARHAPGKGVFAAFTVAAAVAAAFCSGNAARRACSWNKSSSCWPGPRISTSSPHLSLAGRCKVSRSRPGCSGRSRCHSGNDGCSSGGCSSWP